MADEEMSPAQASEYLLMQYGVRMSPATVRRWARDKAGLCTWSGKRMLISRTRLDEYVVEMVNNDAQPRQSEAV